MSKDIDNAKLNLKNKIDVISTSKLVDKKSKFICNLIPVNSQDEALIKLDELRKQFCDARHNCFAYIIGAENELKRSSDDGEPSGTAGKPILEVMEGYNLTNALAVVTRYFGGILLGTGGLVRAYSNSVKLAIENANLVPILKYIKYEIETDYSNFAKIEKLSSDDLMFKNIIYDAKIKAEMYLKESEEDKNIKLVKEIIGNDGTLNRHESVWM